MELAHSVGHNRPDQQGNDCWWPSATQALVIVSFFIAYAPVWAALSMQWWSNDMYSYGYLIPGISLYMVWVRREQLAGVGVQPNYLWGWPLGVVGLFVYVLGQAGEVVSLQEMSLLITLSAVVLLLWGGAVLRVVALPIGYLWLMIPIWEEIVTDRLHAPFQVFSATVAGELLRMLGAPVYREGVFLHLPSITLEVARACSGVNYLIAVIAIGIPLACLFLEKWSRRIALLLFGIVVAVLSNSLRVALIGLLAYYGFEGPLHGPLHVLQGLFVSVIGYAGLFGGLWVLLKTESAARVP